MRVPVSQQQQRIADLLEENARNRWLVRNGHRAYGETARRVGGVHTSRPSDRARGSENASRRNAGPRSSSLGAAVGAIGLLALLIGASWLAFMGLVWLAIELLRWVGKLFGGGF